MNTLVRLYQRKARLAGMLVIDTKPDLLLTDQAFDYVQGLNNTVPAHYPVPATRNDTPPHFLELKYYR